MKLIYSGNASKGSVEYSIDAGDTFVPVTLADLKNGVELFTNDLADIRVRAGNKTFTDIDVLKKFKVIDEKLPRYTENEISIDFYVANIFENESSFKIGETTVHKNLFHEHEFDSDYNLFKETYPNSYEGIYATISFKAPSNMQSFDCGTNFNVCFKNKESGEIVQDIVCKSFDELENAKNNWNVIVEYITNNGKATEYKTIGTIDYEIKSEWSDIFNYELKSAENYVSDYFAGKDFSESLLNRIADEIRDIYSQYVNSSYSESSILGYINDRLNDYNSDLDYLDTDGSGSIKYYYAEIPESQFNDKIDSGSLNYSEMYAPIGTTLSEVLNGDSSNTYIVGSYSSGNNFSYVINSGIDGSLNSGYLKSSDYFGSDYYISEGIKIIKVVHENN
jgi:hypothetical protein